MVDTSLGIKKTRESGMELLRITAMLFVVLVHTDFWALGAPTHEFITLEPTKAFMQYLVEIIAIVCVNCFIFISGWFGIKPKMKKFIGLLFQIIFFNFVIYFISVAIGHEHFSVSSFLIHSNFLELWFIPPYIALYWLAPILNTFVEKSSHSSVFKVLVAYILLDLILGWGKDYLHFVKGYSLLNFILIYLIARYINHYKPKWSQYRIRNYFFIYVLICLFLLVFIYSIYILKPDAVNQLIRLFFYNSPIVLVASICFCLIFTKLNFKSKLVNWIAYSSFGIYLPHQDSLIGERWMKRFCQNSFNSHDIFYYSVVMLALVASFFVLAILLDQIRLIIWRFLTGVFENKCNRR